MKMTFPRIFFGGLVVFTIMVLMVVFMPVLMWRPEPTVNAHPYTEQQLLGRQLFWSNGCNYCHTQYVREADNAMGPVSRGGDFIYDTPPLLGSERTGPDLTHIGRKRTEQWEIEHLRDPRAYSPMSIMPSFVFLSEDELRALASYLYDLGDRVAQVRMVPSPPEYAQAEDPNATTLVSTAGDAPKGWPTWTAAGLQRGKEIYIDRCLTCHGCAGNGLGSYAGTLIVTPADFKQTPFRTMPPDQWFWHVSEGVQGTVMPPWKQTLNEAERWDVIRYARTIFARPTSHDPDEGDPPADYAALTNPLPLDQDTLDRGKAVYTRECLVCHGDAGRGEGPYRAGLQPTPPDFGDGSYGTLAKPVYSDADYYWRISEGVPWTAMPSWRLRYGEAERWALVHYVRALLTQTEQAPGIPDPEFLLPDIYKAQRLPATASLERGKGLYAEHCAHCHGLAMDGQGWDGKGLNPVPADFRDMAKEEQRTPEGEGENLAKLTFGIHNSAMPAWGEFLPMEQRQDVLKYLLDAVLVGLKQTHSVYEPGRVAAAYATASRDMWINDAGGTVDPKAGAEVWAGYCATCHGDHGAGDGPGTVGTASPGPAPLPDGMTDAMTDGYVFWRVAQGVPGSTMPGFTVLLDDAQLWNVVAWVTDGGWKPATGPAPAASSAPGGQP
ncbi:MAG: c-type cytochrome [Desulfovibrionaceae bacterium]